MVVEKDPATTRALDDVLARLDAFKRKFYISLLVRGLLVTGGLLLSLFLVFNLLEYFLYLPTWVRAGLFFGFVGGVVYAFGRWIWQPLSALTNLRRMLSDEQAAQRVGELFPDVQDKLLNALQLRGQAQDNALLAASLEQRAGQLRGVEFSRGINIKAQTKPLWKYVAVPAAVVALLLLVYPSLFVQGTERILHYNRKYTPPAPFRFVVENKNLTAFKGEDFTLNVTVEGTALPNEISIVYDGRERHLVREAGNRFRFDFRQLRQNVAFQLAAAGFTSSEYDLTVRARPNLRDFAVRVSYPAYLRKPAETIRNTGNLTVPEGSDIRWEFDTEATDQLQLKFRNPDETVTAQPDASQFLLARRAVKSQQYSVHLRNAASPNRDPIEYQLTVIPDLVPEVTLEAFQDSTSLRYLALGGNVRDDYGLSRLQLHYRVLSKGRPNAGYQTRALPLGSGPSQSYAYQWDVRPLNLRPGDRLEYFVQVWDNDGVHGPKAARSRTAEFRLPNRTELRQQLASQSQAVQSQLSQAAQESKKMERELAKAEDKLKVKRDLNFQDRKQLKDMLDQKQQMDQALNDLKRQFEQLQEQQNQLDPQKNEELAQKAEELKKLMETLLDPETKKLYEELQKLLDQQQDQNQPDMQKLLQQLENKENTLQKELERALEMFKQLQFEQKQDQALEKLQQLAQEQQKLADETQKNDKNNPDNNLSKDQQQQKQQNLKQQQTEQQQKFEELKQDLKQMKELDEQLDGQNGADEMKQDQEQVDEQQQESQDQLGKSQNQKASQSQKQAAQKMQQMAQKMQQQMDQEESDEQQENIDDLRDILENLLKLSFDQENLMKQFRTVDQSDPRFVQLGQTQRKLKDDARVVQDSLYALAKRVFQIKSFVTREVGEMNGRMDESLDQIRQRSIGRATNSQQLAMTSMNNLALMLNDALQQMQEQQRQSQSQQQQGGGKPGRKKKKGSSAGEGQLGRMQQQLNQQIQQLQQSGKQGRALSEELAKLAGQQQMLRQAMQELERMQQKSGGKPGSNKDGKGQDGAGGLGDVKKMMEQTETDLVNKRLTEQTIMRQRQILTRLLEAEKSARERDQDDKREAQTAQNRPPVFPPAFQQYKRQQNRQTELLRTVPPALTPYYQREVSEYFQKMK
ncbi:ATPase [Hymenobacter seoulensis]